MTQLDIRQLAEQGGVNPIAPVTVPEAVKFEDGNDLTTAIGSIATIETSPATEIHTAGEYLVWNGQLYKVLAGIAVGDTLTVNTNIEATNLGSELNAGLTYNFVDLISNGTFPSQPTSSSSQTYTVPQNGMMFFWATRGSDPGWTLKINVNGHNEVFAFPAVVGYTIASISFPVKTGDTVNISTDDSVASWTVHQAKFIY